MADPLPDPFEFIKALWSPMGLPIPGMVAPILDTNEIEKKIADLKSVENWLNLNLNMLRLSIQGLEMQRNTLAAMQSMQMAPGQNATDASAKAPLDATAWWNLMQAAMSGAANATQSKAVDADPGAAKRKK